MRILFLTHTFNSLAQRLFVELTERGHQVSIEYDINDAVATEAVALFEPELIIAPFLKRAIPDAIWSRTPCIVLHPGIIGDRGPSALDWAIMNDETEWGVTALQANAEMDAGDIWASSLFPMRAARKSSIYRNEITDAAVMAVLNSLDRFQAGDFRPTPLDYSNSAVRGQLRAAMHQSDRAIDWTKNTTETVLRKIRAADSIPGVLDQLGDESYYLFNATADGSFHGRAGDLLAQRDGAVCRATTDGAVWISHLRPQAGPLAGLKLPATVALGDAAGDLRDDPIGLMDTDGRDTLQEIGYHEEDGVGYLRFAFYNGAMGTEQCQRLLAAYRQVRRRDVRIIALTGGPDFWSNGIHLNLIEHSLSPADESWRNINAMNDLAREIITTDDKLTVAALQGNAGAGGVFLALATDRVLARRGVILNPHYKGMGNLYGSEYWTYTLPRRAKTPEALQITDNRLPLGTTQATAMGLVDEVIDARGDEYTTELKRALARMAQAPELGQLLQTKQAQRHADEQIKPLERYREEELKRMQLNFYGFDPSYHVARYNFVHRRPHSWTPLHLALHRRRVASAA